MLKLKYFFFYTVSMLFFSGALLILLNFENLSKNIFYDYYLYNATPDPFYQLFLGLLTFMGLTFLILLTNNRLYITVWLIKIFVLVFIGGLYEYLYTGLDQYSYLSKIFFEEDGYLFYEHATAFIRDINILLTYIGGESFYSLKILNAFIAFIALIILHKLYHVILNKESILCSNKYQDYLFFLMPTLLFWTSFIGKDTIILLPIALFVYSFVHFIDQKKMFYILLMIISIIFLGLIRQFWVIIMLTTLYLYYFRFNRTQIIIIPTMVIFMYLIYYWIFGETVSIEKLFYRLGELQQAFSRGNSAISLPQIHTVWDYLLYFIPNAFITLFAPLPFWGTSNPFLWFFSFENLIYLIGMILYIGVNIKTIFHNPYLKFLFLLLISWLLIYVILSPGNLGTALRYKSQVIPIMMILLLTSYHINPIQFTKNSKNINS